MSELIIDGASVIREWPDGRSRDEADAAAQLQARVATADLPYNNVVLVLPGHLRSLVPAGDNGRRVYTLHAAISSDSTIIDQVRAAVSVGRAVAVLTADQALATFVALDGAEIARPRWLLDKLAI